MNRVRKFSSGVALGMGLVALSAAFVSADMLTTTNGTVYFGTITKTGEGYIVRPDTGEPLHITTGEVRRVVFDHPQAATPSPAALTSVASSSHKVDPRMVKALLGQGVAAYTRGAFTDARDSFADAQQVDPTNTDAARGLGFSYLRLDKPVLALKSLEFVYKQTPRPDRSLTLAIASALVATHNPMRAASDIESWFKTHPTPDDEKMLNAFGTAMSQAADSAAGGKRFKDAASFYEQLDATLDATRPGQKRWGSEWEDADEVDRKNSKRADAESRAASTYSNLQTLNSQVVNTQASIHNVGLGQGSAGQKYVKVQGLQGQLRVLQDRQGRAQSAYDDARQALSEAPKPEFPATIPTDDIELFPAPVAPVEVASAGGTSVVTPTQTSPNTIEPPRPPVQAAVNIPVKENTPLPAVPPTPPTPVKVEDSHVTRYAVAFAVAPDLVVTASDVVATATDVHIETPSGVTMKAEILRTNQGLGLALLRVVGAHMSCLAVAPELKAGAVAAWGFPNVSIFTPIPQAMPCSPLPASEKPWSIRFQIPPRLPAGPVLQDGAIVGVEMAGRDSDPSDVPAITLAALQKFVGTDAKPGTPTNDPKAAIVQIVAEN